MILRIDGQRLRTPLMRATAGGRATFGILSDIRHGRCAVIQADDLLPSPSASVEDTPESGASDFGRQAVRSTIVGREL